MDRSCIASFEKPNSVKVRREGGRVATARVSEGRGMSAHTPGPWTKRGGGPSYVKDDDRADVPFHVVKVDEDEQGRRRTAFVAVCDATTLNNDANAQLIAAAPDLLNELQRCQDVLFGLLDYFDPGHELTEINKQRDRNTAAIAKAEGR